MVFQNTPQWCAHEPFDTLADCLAFVRKEHPQQRISGTAVDIQTDQESTHCMPRYVYRGEIGWFEECISRRERVRRKHFPGVSEQALQPIGVDVDRSLQERLSLPPMLAAGLMQHYGWPTELIDASASLDTAAFFARHGASGPGEGALAVIDIATARQNGVVVDLSEHPMAVRPRLQEAYGIWHSRHRDLKQAQAISDMGLSWYVFRDDPQHDCRVMMGQVMLSVLDDATAGLLRLWIDGAISQHGKMLRRSCRLLSYAGRTLPRDHAPTRRQWTACYPSRGWNPSKRR